MIIMSHLLRHNILSTSGVVQYHSIMHARDLAFIERSVPSTPTNPKPPYNCQSVRVPPAIIFINSGKNHPPMKALDGEGIERV